MRELTRAEYVWRLQHERLEEVEGALGACPSCKASTRIVLVGKRRELWCPACVPDKQCATCKRNFPITEFHAVAPAGQWRLESYCPTCSRERSRLQYHKPRSPTRPVAKYATCRECKQKKLGDAYFAPDPRTKSGWEYVCEACKRQRSRGHSGRPVGRPRRDTRL